MAKLASPYIVAAMDAGFCLHKAAFLWGVPWYSPYLIIGGCGLPRHIQYSCIVYTRNGQFLHYPMEYNFAKYAKTKQ